MLVQIEYGVGEEVYSLVDFIAAKAGISKKNVRRMLDARRVFVNKRRIWIASYRLTPGDVVEYPAIMVANAPNTRKEIEIIWQNAGLVVVNKPAGLVCNAAKGSLEERLRRQLKKPRLEVLHRLDKDTTGVLIAAIKPSVKAGVIAEFAEKRVYKEYLALVSGVPATQNGRINTPIDGKSAKTSYRVLASNQKFSYLSVEISSGRTHQIRIHLASIGHPLLGDSQYTTGRVHADIGRQVPRQMLHAYRLGLVVPSDGKRHLWKAALPADFQKLQTKLLN